MPAKSYNWPSFLLAVVLSLSACATFSNIKADSKPGSSRKSSGDEEWLRQGIAGYAQNYLGLKYKYAGRNPETGFDCSGFTSYVMGVFNIKLSVSSTEQAKQGQTIQLKEVQTGDLIFFRQKKGGRISHVALVVSNDNDGLRVIHSTSRGIVVDDLFSSKYWKPKIAFAKDVVASAP
jgi:cell wall-associated NlpC family hydrolase